MRASDARTGSRAAVRRDAESMKQSRNSLHGFEIVTASDGHERSLRRAGYLQGSGAGTISCVTVVLFCEQFCHTATDAENLTHFHTHTCSDYGSNIERRWKRNRESQKLTAS